jgi:hypothetical protein
LIRQTKTKVFTPGIHFELQKVDVEVIKVSFYCREKFYSTHKNWHIKIETEFGKEITEAIRFNDEIKVYNTNSDKTWFNF